MLSSIALGVQPSFFWPGSGGGSAASAGEAQPGNLRMAHSGNVTGGFGDGFLSLNTQWASVHHIGSTYTGVIGHSGLLDRGSGGSFPQTWKWLCQEGSFTTTSSVTTYSIVFPIAYATVAPTVQLTAQQNNTQTGIGFANIVNGSVTTSGFSSTVSLLGVTQISAFTLLWRSEGTVAV